MIDLLLSSVASCSQGIAWSVWWARSEHTIPKEVSLRPIIIIMHVIVVGKKSAQ